MPREWNRGKEQPAVVCARAFEMGGMIVTVLVVGRRRGCKSSEIPKSVEVARLKKCVEK